MTAIVDNVVSWYEGDIFSKKLGPLFANYMQARQGTLGELLMGLLLTQLNDRPAGRLHSNRITRSHKNSFYLYKIYRNLWGQFKIAFASRATRQELRKLVTTAIAKHQTGAKQPNVALVAKVAKALDKAQEHGNDKGEPHDSLELTTSNAGEKEH